MVVHWFSHREYIGVDPLDIQFRLSLRYLAWVCHPVAYGERMETLIELRPVILNMCIAGMVFGALNIAIWVGILILHITNPWLGCPSLYYSPPPAPEPPPLPDIAEFK